MKETGRATFVQWPRDLEEVKEPNTAKESCDTAYEVVKRVNLSVIDYENFAADMTVWRPFLEKHTALCSAGAVFRCLRVHYRGQKGAILVVPDPDPVQKDCPWWVAYLDE